jgi:hypothetical protein
MAADSMSTAATVGKVRRRSRARPSVTKTSLEPIDAVRTTSSVVTLRARRMAEHVPERGGVGVEVDVRVPDDDVAELDGAGEAAGGAHADDGDAGAEVVEGVRHGSGRVGEADAAPADGDRGAVDVDEVVLVVAAGRAAQDRAAAEEVRERRDLFAHRGDDDGRGSSSGVHPAIFAHGRHGPGERARSGAGRSGYCRRPPRDVRMCAW